VGVPTGRVGDCWRTGEIGLVGEAPRRLVDEVPDLSGGRYAEEGWSVKFGRGSDAIGDSENGISDAE